MSTGLVFLSHLNFARGFDTDVHTYLRHTGMSSCPLTTVVVLGNIQDKGTDGPEPPQWTSGQPALHLLF